MHICAKSEQLKNSKFRATECSVHLVWTERNFSVGSESISGGSSYFHSRKAMEIVTISILILRCNQERNLELRKTDKWFITWFLPNSSQPSLAEHKLFFNS